VTWSFHTEDSADGRLLHATTPVLKPHHSTGLSFELAAGLEGVNRAAEWLSKQERASAKSRSSRIRTSYGLKHDAEPEVGYTTNGEFIAAALILGIEVDTKSGDLNPNVGVLAPKR